MGTSRRDSEKHERQMRNRELGYYEKEFVDYCFIPCPLLRQTLLGSPATGFR